MGVAAIYADLSALYLDLGNPVQARAALAERASALLPPFSRFAVLRAEAHARDAPHQFLKDAAGATGRPDGVEIWGPVPD